MQTAQQKQDFTQCYKVTSYELITKWIDKAFTLDLSPNAIQLMTTLLRFYNADKKYVFPHQDTLARLTNTSLATIKRGLAELIKSNLLIKTRKQNGNVYAFTGRLFELLNGTNQPTEQHNLNYATAQNELCMKEPNKDPNKTTHADVVQISNKKKSEPVSLDDVPAIIKSNPKIKNPIGYFLSIPIEDRKELIAKEQEKERRKKERAEREKQERIKAEQERSAREKELAKPLSEQWTKQQAIKFVYNLRNFPKLPKNGLATDLINLYNLDTKQIFQMTAEQIEQL